MVFQLNHLMDVVTTHLVLKNNLSSQKSTSTMLIKVRGMDIVIVTTANTDEEGRELLKGLGMPFAKII